MAVEEKYERGTGKNRRKRGYLISGASSEDDAVAQMLAVAPGSIGTWPIDDWDADELPGTGGRYNGTVYYAKPADEGGGGTPVIGQTVFEFDTSGGTAHRTTSLATVTQYRDNAQLAGDPNFDGLIGWDGETAQGTDVIVPVFNFGVTKYFNPADVTESYIDAVFRLTGKTNNATFRGLAAGEVLFLGAAGRQRGTDPFEIRFQFAASPNIGSGDGLTVGAMTGIVKKGWEYLWAYYMSAPDGTAKILVAKPAAVFIEKVYFEGSFGDLNL